MGRTLFSPSTQRFASVVHAPCVYVAELSNGVLKVGASGSARARMMSLANEVKREHGLDMGRFHVFPKKTPKRAYEAETLLVREIGSIATPVPGRREFFTGVSFDQVLELLESLGMAREAPRTESEPQEATAYVAARHGLFAVPVQVTDFYA